MLFSHMTTAAFYRVCQIIRLRYGCEPGVCHLHDDEEAEKKQGGKSIQWTLYDLSTVSDFRQWFL